MTFSCMSPEEVRTKYKAAEDKNYIIGVLADLTASTKNDVRSFLGLADIPERKIKEPVRLDEEKARALYDEGHTDKDIAVALNVSKYSVWSWRKRNGLPHNAHTRGDDGRMDLYLKGLHDREIASAVGVSKSAIYDWRKANGLPPNSTQGGDRVSKKYIENRKRRGEDADRND